MIHHLRDELAKTGIVVDAERRQAITSGIVQRGRAEFNRLRRESGLPMESVENSAVASLGMGTAITEFATAQIGIPADLTADVAALGGLATLIVSGFDAIVDSGGTPPEIILGATRQPAGRYGNLKRQILVRLVEVYYARLDRMPQTHSEVRSIVDRAIARMYAAELRSATGQDASRSVWWRKNVLPFVAMAAPGWLAIPRWSPKRFREHVRWLCRLGEFLGWVDDCVDLRRDVSLGQVNRVRGCLGNTSEATLALRVARQGGRILREWDAAGSASPVRDTFAVIVWSWIDNGVRKAAD